jgi:hypothetical protein
MLFSICVAYGIPITSFFASFLFLPVPGFICRLRLDFDFECEAIHCVFFALLLYGGLFVIALGLFLTGLPFSKCLGSRRWEAGV